MRSAKNIAAAFKSALRFVSVASRGSIAIIQSIVFRFLVLGINFATGILSARFLGPVGRADQTAMLLGIGLFPFLFSFGLQSAVQFKIKTDPKVAENFVTAGAILAVAFGCISAGIGAVALPHVIGKYSGDVLHAAQLFMLLAPLVLITEVLIGVLQARDRFGEVNFFRSIVPVLTLFGLVALAFARCLTPLGSAVSYALPIVVVLPWLWGRVKPRLTSAAFSDSSAGLLSYGLRSYATDVFGYFMAQVDQLLVIGLISPASMGLYAVALSASKVVDLISVPIVTVLFPKAASLKPRAIAELTAIVTRLTVALLGASGLVLVLLLPFVLPAFYGAAYARAIPIAQILVLNFVFSGAAFVASQAFRAAGKPGVLAVIQGATLLLTIPLILFLVPTYASYGAAWAMSIANGIRFAAILVCFRLVLHEAIPSVVVTLRDVKFVWSSLRLSREDRSGQVSR